jgi:hypothetical protein
MPAQVESQSDTWSLTNLITPSYLSKKPADLVLADPADELLDLLENGYARESITHEVMTPREPEEDDRRRGRPHRCFCFKRIGKEIMELHTDSGNRSAKRFLLSAKKVKDTFYISPYAFKTEDNAPEEMRRCAVLRKVPYGTNGDCYKLFLDGCEGSDRNQIYEGVCEPDSEQKLLAEIWHSMAQIDGADTVMRSLRVTIPTKVKGSVRDQWETSSNSSTSSSEDEGGSDPISLVTKLPKWNAQMGNMTQKFHGNRVKRSSAKNFILTTDKFAPRLQQGTAMQFGKRGKSEYILDHTSPLSSLQAFAIALTMCNWMGDE